MLITVNVTHTLQETIELALPAFYSEFCFVTMINEDQTIIQVAEKSDQSATILSWSKENDFHEEHLSSTLKNGKPISEYEFMKAWHSAMNYFESKMKPQTVGNDSDPTV